MALPSAKEEKDTVSLYIILFSVELSGFERTSYKWVSRFSIFANLSVLYLYLYFRLLGEVLFGD